MGKENNLPRIDFTDFLEKEYDLFFKECNFTDRQKQILLMKKSGNYYNYQIADELHIGDTTLKKEIKKIKTKILKII